MVQLLPWLLTVTLGGASTAHAAPDAVASPEGTDAAPGTKAAGERSASEPPRAVAAPASEPPASVAAPSSEPPAASAASPATTEPPASSPSPAPAPATEQPAAAPSPAPAPAATPPATTAKDARPPRTYPRLVLAGGPVVGPHAIGNEQCDPARGRCETKGSFIGVGAQVELRARLWRFFYAHARGLTVGNASPNDRVHRGLWGAGAGVGVQGRRAFGRAEYLFVSTFGDNHFEPPFFEGEVASDEWGHHAGMLSVGFRQPLPHRLAVELWGGLVIGPRSVRRVPDTLPDERVLTTFLVGLNVSWDAWP